jgi:zinc protease
VTFCNKYKNHFLDNEPIPSIDFTYETMKQVAPMMPLEAVNEVMKELLPPNDTNLVVMSFNQ